MFHTLLLWIFIGATGVQLFFWLYFFRKLAVYWETIPASSPYRNGEHYPTFDSPREHVSAQPVSIIICEKNDAEKLLPHLDRFLSQSDRSLELLVISHNSHRKIKNILSSSHRQKRHLRLISLNDGRVGKKFALARGIQEARYQVLLLTDADCLPASSHWMHKMAAKIDDGADIVLGFAPYEEAPGLLNKFIRFETCYTAIQYMSFALAGLPYMGVGRNLAYTKSLYNSTGGFKQHEHIASGDDDLFVNAAARTRHVSIQIDPDTFVFSPAKTTWSSWFRQKTRHFSTGRLYKLHHQLLLGLLAMSHTLHYVGGILVGIEIDPIYTLAGYVVRMSVVTALSSVILSKLQHRKLRWWVPALDALFVLYYFVFAPRVLWNTNTQRWN